MQAADHLIKPFADREAKRAEARRQNSFRDSITHEQLGSDKEIPLRLMR
jgi:hypothetical protein